MMGVQMAGGWILAADGTAVRSGYVASFIIREVKIPHKGIDEVNMWVVAAVFPYGGYHHDIAAFKSRADAEAEIKRLTKGISQ